MAPCSTGIDLLTQEKTIRRLLPLLLAAITQVASANPSSVTLHTGFTGPNNCLDIVNAGNHDQLHMVRCGRYSGQMWEIVPDAGNSFVRLRTLFTGAEMCLDVVNDGTNDQVHMASCANVTGQQWHMDQTGPGQGVRLWNQFTGQAKCLDIVNDGSGRVQLASCGNYLGQYWSKVSGSKRGGRRG
jgi:hypothetical protein